MSQLTQREREDFKLGLQAAVSICNEYLSITRKVPFNRLGEEMGPLLRIILRHLTVPDGVYIRYVTDNKLEHYLISVQFAPDVWDSIKVYDPTPPPPGTAN